jgi:hypothetical protein
MKRRAETLQGAATRPGRGEASQSLVVVSQTARTHRVPQGDRIVNFQQ